MQEQQPLLNWWGNFTCTTGHNSKQQQASGNTQENSRMCWNAYQIRRCEVVELHNTEKWFFRCRKSVLVQSRNNKNAYIPRCTFKTCSVLVIHVRFAKCCDPNKHTITRCSRQLHNWSLGLCQRANKFVC